LILDILAIGIFVNLLVGILLGIIGIILQTKNRIDIKKEKTVSKIRKIVTLIFCILGTLAFIIVICIAVFYFVKTTKPPH